MKKNNTIILLTLIILIAATLRLYKISSIPPGLYLDEISIGYNAYSLLESGKDEFGRIFPLIFEAYGEYKLPVYIYFTAISMVIFGRSEFAVRFPSALAGVLSVIFTFFLVKELFISKGQRAKGKGQKYLPLLSSFFLAISPWHLQFSRAGFEANLALLFIITAVFIFLKSIRRKSNLLSLSIFLFVMASAAYNSARLFSPILLLTLMIIFRKQLKNMKKELYTAIALGFIAVLPFIPAITSGRALIRAQSESIFKLEKPLHSFFENYLANFDTTFLFFRGDQNGRHSVRKLGMLYIFELPLIILGIKTLIKEKYSQKSKVIIFSWLLLAPIPVALTTINPHSLRLLHVLPVWHIISAIGLVTVLKYLNKYKRLYKYSLIVLGFVVIFSLTQYLHQYYSHYIKETALDWSNGVKETVEVISQNYNDYDKIYVSNKLALIYVAFHLPIKPEEYQSLDSKQTIGKLQFVNDNSAIDDEPNQKTLVISYWWEKPPEGKEYQQINMINRDTLFYIWEL